MHRHVTKSHRLLALALCVCVLATGCEAPDRPAGNLENQPPKVWLSGGPPEGSTQSYRLHMYWGGSDPDGKVAYFEYAITDNDDRMFNPADTVGADKWHRISATDHEFVFTADELVDSSTTDPVSMFARSHTFFIRAVDDQGLNSPRPAYVSFTATTLSPQVNIHLPRFNGLNPTTVPPIATFRWSAIDYIDDLTTVQPPDSVQWALLDVRPFDDSYSKAIAYLRKDRDVLTEFGLSETDSDGEWYDWIWYQQPEDAGRLWTTSPLEPAPYVFAIRAKDEAGAVTPVLDEVRNVRRIRVSGEGGPLLTARNEYLGPITTASLVTPPVIADFPAGVALSFEWSASANAYGGVVTGYRYGWDIEDLSDPKQWEIDYTPFTSTTATSPPRTFYFTTHVFTVEVIDNSGFATRAEFKLNMVPFPMERSILVVDDFAIDQDGFQAGWENPVGRGLLPNDDEHDAFWDDMLSNVADYNPTVDVREVYGDDELRLGDVANYKSIVWSVYSHVDQVADLPLLYEFLHYRQKNPSPGSIGSGTREVNVLALYMAAGGHVLIAGQNPVSTVRNRGFDPLRYPMIFLYELEGEQDGTPDVEDPIGDESFAYRELCLDVMDFSVGSSVRSRDDRRYCDVSGVRNIGPDALRDNSMRHGIPIDPHFQTIELRPEAAAEGKAYDPVTRGLDTEVYNPQYFFDLCQYTPASARECFEPIWGLGCLDANEPTYNQPVAFWTSAFADRVAEAPGAVGARSVVFGFPPVYFKPEQMKPAFEQILFGEWQLPRVP